MIEKTLKPGWRRCRSVNVASFLQQTDALVEMLNGLITEGIARV
jgi:hypothetical protein